MFCREGISKEFFAGGKPKLAYYFAGGKDPFNELKK
jgi:hypothetical protein